MLVLETAYGAFCKVALDCRTQLMNTPVGLLAKGDLLQFQLDGGTMALAFALGFASKFLLSFSSTFV